MDEAKTKEACTALLDAIGEGQIVVDADLRILYAGGSVADAGQPSGRPLSGIIPELSAAAHAVRRERCSRIEPGIAYANRLYLVWLGLLTDRAGDRVLCLFFDHDAALAAATRMEDLQALIREHETIIDSSSDGLFVCDANANVIRMNPASERIHNVAAAQIVGRNMADLLKEGFIDRSAAYEAIHAGKTISLLQNKDGRKLISIATPVFDETGAIIRVVVSERDITRIDALQRELEEQEAIKDEFRHKMLEMQQAELESQRIVARSPAMIRALNQALKVAAADSSVLILGESGVGKGLFADLIHKHSGRAEAPLIKINCGAIPESLIESELFGYEKGAFTGAAASKPGHFELADRGILFLDEIAELPLASQVKLLRFLEDGRITRLGGTRSRIVDVRILAATHRNLDEMVAQGRFRLDLFYRLNVIPIQVPALRERRDCILPLVRHYLDAFGTRLGRRRRLTRAASDALLGYAYPGNVRELMNICERLAVMSETELIDIDDLPASIVGNRPVQAIDMLDWPEEMTLTQILESVERAVLQRASRRGASQQQLAAGLGVSQPTVARRLRHYGLTIGRGNRDLFMDE